MKRFFTLLVASGAMALSAQTIIEIDQNLAGDYAAGAEIVLVYSIIITVLGIVFMIRPNLVMQLLSFVIGVYFLVDGIVKFRHGTLVPDTKDFIWYVMLMLSLALIVAGIALLINPFSGTMTVIRFAGIAFVISGIESIAEESWKKR